MKKSSLEGVLLVMIIFLNTGFILFTINSQSVFELAYNNVVLILNIMYLLLGLLDMLKIFK